MKNKILSMLAFAAAVTFTACDDDNEGLTRITYYPSITLEGESFMIHQKGEPFVEPGYTSLLNGEDVTDGVTVSGAVNVNRSGLYTLTYTTVKNEDGFSGSTSRTVFVLDQENPMEGFFTTGPRTQRVDGIPFGPYEVMIYEVEDGIYFVDDLLGGWYRDRAGYGDDYTLKGYIAVAEDGTIEVLDNGFALWPYFAETWENGHYADGTFFWTVGFQGLAWDVELVK